MPDRLVPQRPSRIPDGVTRLGHLDLIHSAVRWQLELDHGPAIDAYWDAMRAKNPKYFNGIVHVATAAALVGDTLSASILATDYKSFLYWRANPSTDTAARDIFGSAVVISADGAVLLGVQSAGNLNSGLAYPPGGMIDARDIGADGRLDLAANAARELAEETGLGAPDVTRTQGFVLTAIGNQLAVGVVYSSRLTALHLERRVTAFLAGETEPELTGVVFARSLSDADRIPSPHFVRPLLAHLLPV